MKSVLFCKMEAPQYSSAGMVQSFKDLGFEDVYEFNWQDIRFNEGIIGMQSRLIGAANMYQPELIFLHIQNGECIDPDTVQSLSEIAPVVNYTFDVRSKEETEWMYELVPFCALTIFACHDDVIECTKRGFTNIASMHSSCNYEWYRPLPLGEREGIVFIGNNYLGTNHSFPQSQQRYDMVHFMRKEFGKEFKCFGQNWDFDTKTVNPQEEITEYNRAKIAITHNNFDRVGYTSDRIFRSMGCRTFTISQYFSGINKSFSANVLSTWLNFDMLKEECNLALRDSRKREAIAMNGYSWVKENHSWKNRFELMIKILAKQKVVSHEQ